MSLISKKVIIRPSNLESGHKISIHGYKHAMVQIFAMAIAKNVKVSIMNVPIVDDTKILCEIINYSGGKANIVGHKVIIDTTNMIYRELNLNLTSKIHGSLYLISAFAIRFGIFKSFETGGCQIGDKSSSGKRPTSQIIDILKIFGGNIDSINGIGTFDNSKNYNKTVILDIMEFSDDKIKLTGSKVSGATKIAILYALTTKATKIKNAYIKTDVMDMIRLIRMIGYDVNVINKDIIISRSEEYSLNKNIEFYLTSCPSEIITYISLAVTQNIELIMNVRNIKQLKETLKLEFSLLKNMGVNLEMNDSYIIVKNVKYPLKNLNIIIDNESIQSDHHPFFTLMLLRSDSMSNIKEYVWKNRFAYAEELKKIGAKLNIDGNSIDIYPSKLSNDNNISLNCSDTRAGAILLLASLCCKKTENCIENLYHIERGYEDLIEILISLGADISIIEE